MLLNGFDVWITLTESAELSDTRIAEYSAKIEAEKHTSCWIPSAAGKQFSIHWTDHQRRQTAGYCFIDGSSVGGKVIREPWNTNIVKHDAFQLTSTTSTPFEFSKLELTDDDFYLNDSQSKIKDMGIIQVKLYRVVPGQPRHIANASSLPEMTNKIHERSKKGLVHGVAFGGVRQSYAPSTSVDVQFLDTEPTVFSFRYRPMDVLRADGHAPPDPSSSASASTLTTSASSSSKGKGKEKSGFKRKAAVVIDLSDDEEEIAALEAKLKRAKEKKFGKVDEKPNKKVKKESGAVKIPSSVVIDLT